MGALLLSIRGAVELFVISNRFSVVARGIPHSLPVCRTCAILTTILFITTPLLAFKVITSFFGGIFTCRGLVIGEGSRVCIFSRLGRGSLVLTGSLYGDGGGEVVIFASIFREGRRRGCRLIRSTGGLKTIYFGRSVAGVGFNFRDNGGRLIFLVVNGSSSRGVARSVSIVGDCGNGSGVELCVFSRDRRDGLIVDKTSYKGVGIHEVGRRGTLVFEALFSGNNEVFSDTLYVRNRRSGVVSTVILKANTCNARVIGGLS